MSDGRLEHLVTFSSILDALEPALQSFLSAKYGIVRAS
jgi:hypothetical protein